MGKHIGTGEDKAKLDTEIVGVVQNAKYSQVKQEVPPLFFRPYRQAENGVGSLNFYVRAAGDPAPVLRSLPGVMARLDPNLPVEDLKTMPQQIRENVFMDRMISTLAAAFALLATLLAAIGLYGVLAYTVSQRTREIGLRMALGADGARVRGMILKQVAWMTLVGGVIGIIGAYFLGRGAEALLYELKGYDPVVMVSSVVLLTIIAFGAGYIPAYRASRVHPMQALRCEWPGIGIRGSGLTGPRPPPPLGQKCEFQEPGAMGAARRGGSGVPWRKDENSLRAGSWQREAGSCLERPEYWTGTSGFLTQALGGMQRPVRIAQKLARHDDQVGLAAAHDLFGLLGSGDEADGRGRHPRLALDPFGNRHLIAGTHGNALIRHQPSRRAITHVSAKRHQLTGQRDGVVRCPAAVRPVGP